MATTCTRCEGTGFLNAEQCPVADLGIEAVLAWLRDTKEPHDVQVCDCCGNNDDWYGVPGEHYNSTDPPGRNGPYASNGGLCKCH